MSDYQTIIDRDRMVTSEFAEAVRDYYPLRTKIAAKVGRAIADLSWLIGKRLPDGPYHLRLWGGGWDEGGIRRWIGRTVCRSLGHWWELISPGSPSRDVGHQLMCATCTTLVSTDDLDSFDPGTRERRDVAAVGSEIDALCWTARYCLPLPKRVDVSDDEAMGRWFAGHTP